MRNYLNPTSCGEEPHIPQPIDQSSSLTRVCVTGALNASVDIVEAEVRQVVTDAWFQLYGISGLVPLVDDVLKDIVGMLA